MSGIFNVSDIFLSVYISNINATILASNLSIFFGFDIDNSGESLFMFYSGTLKLIVGLCLIVFCMSFLGYLI